jgi:hypothetical protein
MRQTDVELQRKLALLLPSFRAALLGDNVDAQRATLAVIADIPPALAVNSKLAEALASFLQKEIRDPEVIALGVRSFGRSFPDAPDIEKVVGRFVKSEQTQIRLASAEALASAIANSPPTGRSIASSAYFLDVSSRSVPLLAVGIEDKDAATQKAALAGIQGAARVTSELFSPDSGPIGEEPRPKEANARFAPVMPLLRALVDASPKLAVPLSSQDTSTRLAAARTLENLAVLRRAIANARGPGDPVAPEHFANTWKAIGPGVTAGIKDGDPAIRLAITEALETLGDAFEARALLRDASTDTNLFVRWAAARALGKSAPAKPDPAMSAPDVAALTRLIDDCDFDVRTSTLNALAKYGIAAKSAGPKVIAAARRGDIEPRVAAVKALGAIETDAASTVPVLIAGLQNDDVRLRRAAASGLVRFGAEAKAALPELRKALASPDVELRLAAAEAVLAIELKVAKPREL